MNTSFLSSQEYIIYGLWNDYKTKLIQLTQSGLVENRLNQCHKISARARERERERDKEKELFRMLNNRRKKDKIFLLCSMQEECSLKKVLQNLL